MNNVSLEEAKLDLLNTQRDYKCILSICENLETFITQSGGEDRSKYKLDLFRYKALLQQATELEIKIGYYISTYEAS